VVLKRQITPKSPAKRRDFTSIFMKIMEFNKAQADAKAQSATHSGG
jgi:hypothetical protein